MENTGRIHALDALRAFALLLGIVLHATVSFLPGFADLDWPIIDNSPSTLLGIAFYVIHIFRMTIFFLLAGFFARLMFQRQGANSFFTERAKRILIPLVVGWPVLVPLLGASMVWGTLQLGKPIVHPPPRQAARCFHFLWRIYGIYGFCSGYICCSSAADGYS